MKLRLSTLFFIFSILLSSSLVAQPPHAKGGKKDKSDQIEPANTDQDAGDSKDIKKDTRDYGKPLKPLPGHSKTKANKPTKNKPSVSSELPREEEQHPVKQGGANKPGTTRPDKGGDHDDYEDKDDDAHEGDDREDDFEDDDEDDQGHGKGKHVNKPDRPGEDKRAHAEEKSSGHAFSGKGKGGDKNLVDPEPKPAKGKDLSNPKKLPKDEFEAIKKDKYMQKKMEALERKKVKLLERKKKAGKQDADEQN